MTKQRLKLDEETRNAFDAMAREEQNRVFRTVHQYGLRALAHTHLMARAEEVLLGNLDQNKFVRLFDPLDGDVRLGRNIALSLNPLESEGVYVSDFHRHYDLHRDYLTHEKRFILFDGDLGNGFTVPLEFEPPEIEIPPQEMHYPDRLTELDRYFTHRFMRKPDWKMEELIDPEVIKDGKAFGKLLFECALYSYHEYVGKKGERVLNTEEKELGSRLAEHYQQAMRMLLGK